jgi:hypothetical protein
LSIAVKVRLELKPANFFMSILRVPNVVENAEVCKATMFEKLLTPLSKKS